MSASPIARQSFSHAQLIPSMRKVLISEPSQMPEIYSSTPGGTIYGTTPGGTYKTILLIVSSISRTNKLNSVITKLKTFHFALIELNVFASALSTLSNLKTKMFNTKHFPCNHQLGWVEIG